MQRCRGQRTVAVCSCHAFGPCAVRPVPVDESDVPSEACSAQVSQSLRILCTDAVHVQLALLVQAKGILRLHLRHIEPCVRKRPFGLGSALARIVEQHEEAHREGPIHKDLPRSLARLQCARERVQQSVVAIDIVSELRHEHLRGASGAEHVEAEPSSSQTRWLRERAPRAARGRTGRQRATRERGGDDRACSVQASCGGGRPSTTSKAPSASSANSPPHHSSHISRLPPSALPVPTREPVASIGSPPPGTSRSSCPDHDLSAAMLLPGPSVAVTCAPSRASATARWPVPAPSSRTRLPRLPQRVAGA
eukprot:6463263-Prymnesium_polylepis.2